MSQQTLVLTGTVIATLFVVVTLRNAEVSAQAKPIILDVKHKQLFNIVERNQKKPYVILYYSSSECKPCLWSLKPMLEKMVRRKGDFVNMGSVDLDKVPELRDEHGINEIPTVMTFFKGDVMDIVEGKNWNPIVALVNRATKLAQ